jgi:hypothetical protein
MNGMTPEEDSLKGEKTTQILEEIYENTRAIRSTSVRRQR